MVHRPCEAVQNLSIPAETENPSLKSHSQPGFPYQMEQGCGIKASNKVGRDAWVYPRRTGPLALRGADRRDLKPELPESCAVEIPRETSPLLLPPDSFSLFEVLVVGGGSCRKCQDNPTWVEA